jgi:tetratricopeptide (TPR) repeat protein
MRSLGAPRAHRPRRRALLLILGPVGGAAVGTITNILTSHWNWWLFSILTVIVGVTAGVAVVLDGDADGAPKRAEGSRVADWVPQRRRSARINTLPRDVDDFTGRRDEVARLLREIDGAAGSSIAVHSIEGMGGIGKTSLAVHVAHRIADRYPDAVLFINLRAHVEGQAPMTTNEALAILLADLGIPGSSIPEQLEGRASLWRRELANARVLVILDNASSPDQIRDLLAGGRRCLILITSRRKLIELEGVSSLFLGTLPADDAVTLFERVLGAERAAGQLMEIADAVRRLAYLPLAIRLAAARLRAHPTWMVRDLLERDISQDSTLERIYTLSYRDLDPNHKAFFRLLSVHPGSEITAEAAAVLTGTSVSGAVDILDGLYNLHLIEEPSHHRFRFHDLIKDFANREGSEMSNEPERQSALRRLLVYYAYMATASSERIGTLDVVAVAAPVGGPIVHPPEDEIAALAWFDAELGNLLACAYYANDKAMLPFAWQLPSAMTSFLRLRGFLAQAVSVLDTALRTLIAEPDTTGEAVVRRRIGHVARLQGDYRLSREELDRSLRLTRELGDRQGLAWCYHELGHLDRLTGDTATARLHLTEALAIQRELGNLAGEGAVATNLAMVLRTDGEFDAARRYFREALRNATESGDRRAEAFAGYQLGALECESGDYSGARDLLVHALSIYDGVRNRHGQADCYFNLAVVDRLAGDYEAAKRYLTNALSIYVELRYRRGEADTHAEFAATAEAAGDPARSLVHRERAATIYAELGLSRP